MKHCGGCNKTKLYSEFYGNISRKDGLAAQCKKCNKESRKLWNDSHKLKMRLRFLDRFENPIERERIRENWRNNKRDEYWRNKTL